MPDTNTTPPALTSPTTETRAKTTSRGSSPASVPDALPTRIAHIVLQGKGGVGKTFIASLIAQYLADHGRLSACFDTDPINGSFQTIAALGAEPVMLLLGNDLNVKEVDRLIESVLKVDRDVVIDSGAASFVPLGAYLIENGVLPVLRENGVEATVHTAVTGGANGIDTLKGLENTLKNFADEARIVVWVNEFFGPCRYKGIDFEQTEIYRRHQALIHGLIYLHSLNPRMFGTSLSAMLDEKLTFAEALEAPGLLTMEKSRLFRIREPIWQQLDGSLNVILRKA